MLLIGPSSSTRRKKSDSSSASIPEPRLFDILCGKDKTFNKHHGNQVFRETIVSYQDMYMQSRSKHEKMLITKEIVASLQAKYNARFVKLSKNGSEWVEITDQVARDKVSHALRFAAKQEQSSSTTSSSLVKSSIKRNSSSSPVSPKRCIPRLLGAVNKQCIAAALEIKGMTSSTVPPASLSSNWEPRFRASTETSYTGTDSLTSSTEGDDDITIEEDKAIESLLQRQQDILQQMNYHSVGQTQEDIGDTTNAFGAVDANTTDSDNSASQQMLMNHDTNYNEYNEQKVQHCPFIPPPMPKRASLQAFDTLRSEDLDAILNEETLLLSLRDEDQEWNAFMEMTQQ